MNMTPTIDFIENTQMLEKNEKVFSLYLHFLIVLKKIGHFFQDQHNLIYIKWMSLKNILQGSFDENYW